jgi:uncharacterized protein YggU (UPF0235/DUF167 family)
VSARPTATEPAADGVVVRVRLTPSGGADRIEGVACDSAGRAHIKARVRAAPEDGKANAALEAMLARRLGLAKSAVSVERGATARLKSVRIVGVGADAVRAALEEGP